MTIIISYSKVICNYFFIYKQRYLNTTLTYIIDTYLYTSKFLQSKIILITQQVYSTGVICILSISAFVCSFTIETICATSFAVNVA